MSRVGDPLQQRLHHGWHSRSYLPHFDMPGRYQFITFRLAGSIPAALLSKMHNASKAGSEEFHDEMDAALDSCYGNCWLRDARIASLMQDALLYFDGQRYGMLHWAIMPNHIHAMIRVEPGWSLSGIIHSWKSFTAREANKLLRTKGEFWQPDYFDRVMRDDRHYFATADYIENNPVKAGLCQLPEDWKSGSAYARTLHS
jgi:REP element-mobilizing transposase RayT